ncbi:unnamed protein product [Rotaria sordida]|uniref:Uncharacterized protein n=1 Tax=Rotaria sordida TaxID=392033 RepID=A0A819J7B1_9BILA|nr:unnamed protein product [Rotaria sordida]CAF3929274.1 unnamed protein product [Rotaria sordida]
MSRWEVQYQYSGITDVMKTNILSAICTAIDLHGSSMPEIGSLLKNWLNETYGNYWTVVIGNPDQLFAGFTYILGHDSEIRQCIQILIQKRKNNFFLIEDSRVTETTILGGLAQRIVHQNVPDILPRRLFALNM